ncbi:MAG: aspartate dehydrogenase domain-containing protein [bacterium]
MMDFWKKPPRTGIVGCGTIGGHVARFIDSGETSATISGLCDIEPERAETLATSLDNPPALYDMKRLVAHSDLVVECAAAGAVPELVELCLEHGRSLLVMSVGGLRPEHLEMFRRKRLLLVVPSGAVSGLDGILAHAADGIKEFVLVTRKPPAAFENVEWVKEQGIELEKMKGETILFEGTPEEAVRRFPQNINVASTLRLVSGFSDLRVRIVADPAVERNVHEVTVKSSLGEITTTIQNRPSSNPKTSALAYASAIATLKKLLSPVRIGT